MGFPPFLWGNIKEFADLEYMHKNSGGAVQSVDEKDRILLLRNSRQNFNLSSLNLKGCQAIHAR